MRLSLEDWLCLAVLHPHRERSLFWVQAGHLYEACRDVAVS